MSPQPPTPTGAAVRPLAGPDLPAVVGLHRATFPVLSSERFLMRAYFPTVLSAGSTGIGLAAERGGRLAGYLTATVDGVRMRRKPGRRRAQRE